MKFKVATFVGVLALCASSAFAGNMWIGLNGGATIPQSDLSDISGTGYYAGGTFCLQVAKQCGLGVDLNYHGLGSKTVSGVDLDAPTVFQGTVYGEYIIKMKSKGYPYIKAGLGMYAVDPKNSVDSKSKFGYNAGLGYNHPMNEKMSLGLDASYHWITSDDSWAAPGESKPSLSVITVGLVLGWGIGGGGAPPATK
jgi:hypothetical protein